MFVISPICPIFSTDSGTITHCWIPNSLAGAHQAGKTPAPSLDTQQPVSWYTWSENWITDLCDYFINSLVLCENIFKHCLSQTVRARELTFWHNVHLKPCVTCHVSHVPCHMSLLIFFVNKVVELIGGGYVIYKAYPFFILFYLFFICRLNFIISFHFLYIYLNFILKDLYMICSSLPPWLPTHQLLSLSNYFLLGIIPIQALT